MLRAREMYYTAETPTPKEFKRHTTCTRDILKMIEYVKTVTVGSNEFYVYRIKTTPHYLFEHVEQPRQAITQPTPVKPQPKKRQRGAVSIFTEMFHTCRKALFPRWKICEKPTKKKKKPVAKNP